ncbi:hypothetical protein F5887DRAFT_64855 [Amanita rubescens]|nr:hypothetical protein F5887DRAFT_64855 [Amanita rubescens]
MNLHKMPTQFEMRQRNAQFLKDTKAGKKPTHPSRSEKMAKTSPINLWALGIVAFVIVGGVLFELVRVIFL